MHTSAKRKVLQLIKSFPLPLKIYTKTFNRGNQISIYIDDKYGDQILNGLDSSRMG